MFNYIGLAKIDNEQAERLDGVSVEKNDVLLNITGDSVARVCQVPDAILPARVNQHVSIIRTNPTRLVPKFLKYYLLNPTFKSWLLNLAGSGATRKALTKGMIENLEISIPPIPEQQFITEILSSLDNKIELNLEINKTLKEMAMAIYKEWFVDFGPFQGGEFEESELGPIPKGWEVGKIGRISGIMGGYAFKSKDFGDEGDIVIKIKNIQNGLVTLGDANQISNEVTMRTDRKFKLSVGDYLIAMTGAEVGKIGLIPEYQKKLWLNQRVGVFRNNTLEIEGAIIAANYLSSNGNFEQIQNLAYGSAQPNISSSQLESIKIALPNNLSELKQFSDILSALHELRLNNYSENVTLGMTRDYLLPKLISGEVKVKNITPQTTTTAG